MVLSAGHNRKGTDWEVGRVTAEAILRKGRVRMRSAVAKGVISTTGDCPGKGRKGGDERGSQRPWWRDAEEVRVNGVPERNKETRPVLNGGGAGGKWGSKRRGGEGEGGAGV